MDIELLLLVLFFFVLPLLEGITKRRRKQDPDGPVPPPRPGTRPGGGEDEGAYGAGAGSEPARAEPAAEMLPDDLWELLTGERREREPGGVTMEEAPEGEPAPWAAEPDAPWGADPTAGPVPDEDGWVHTGEIGSAPADDASWEDRVEAGEIVRGQRTAESLEYMGPEAYSLERPLPSAEVRHAAFHRKIDRDDAPRPSRRRSRLGRALSDRDGLRKAVLLTEVLGPPKGLA